MGARSPTCYRWTERVEEHSSNYYFKDGERIFIKNIINIPLHLELKVKISTKVKKLNVHNIK